MRVFAKADRTYNDFKNINIASAALGCYGLQPLNYAKLISARSSQLYGIKDDLITVQDIVESY